jgi:tungstate transport system substrate-binding protein
MIRNVAIAVVSAWVLVLLAFGIHQPMVIALHAAEPARSGDKVTTVRCAVIGGMTSTGLWQAVSERFEQATGIQVELAVTGPKFEISDAFRHGEADLITMHASDTIINLVADGYGVNPQPWAKNDLLIVGPPSDPAKIRGMTDAVAALEKIIDSKSKLLVHQSLGTNEVLHDLLAAGELKLDADFTIALPSDRHRQMLRRAAQENAYTLVGRIPFLNGKIENDGLVIVVQGDERLRRPYVVVVSSRQPDSPRHLAAVRLSSFLRSRETQTWLAEFGKGQLDNRPLFFPVVVSGNGDAPDGAKVITSQEKDQ